MQGMKDAQQLQDMEGEAHPGETQVYTFPAPTLVRWWLRLQRYEGLSFECYQGEWHGIFRAIKK